MTQAFVTAIAQLIVVAGATSCASTVPSSSTVYRAAPNYPTTIIQLAAGYSLRHEAGSDCHDESRPEIGTSDRVRTYSKYSLLNPMGVKVSEIPSGLSDPNSAGELADHYRKNDLLTVFQSGSGNTVVIVENRSPTFPRIAILLVQRTLQDQWMESEVLAPSSRAKQSQTSAVLYAPYPRVTGITDTEIWFTNQEGESWAEKVEALPKLIHSTSAT